LIDPAYRWYDPVNPLVLALPLLGYGSNSNPHSVGPGGPMGEGNNVSTTALPSIPNMRLTPPVSVGQVCFTEGTQIVIGAMFTESDVFVRYVTINIEDIKVGGWVYSYDTVTGTVEQKEVTAVFVRKSDHLNYLTIADEHGNIQLLEVTDGHPFWVVTNDPDLDRAAREYADDFYHENIGVTETGYWVEAKDLREGDVFLGANGELSTLVSKERVAFPDGIKVYNFTVDGNHNYFVIAKCDEFGQTSILVHNSCAQADKNTLIQNAKKIQKDIKTKPEVNKHIDRIDYKRLGRHELPHIHFKNVRAALNLDGTWKHKPPQNWHMPAKVKEYLEKFIKKIDTW
jgi:hypothetical protein